MPLNFFEELTRHIFYEAKNKDIKFLDLSDDKITVLPDIFDKLKHLEHVNLCNNQISELPHSFYLLPNLKTLVLSNNRFTEVPYSFIGFHLNELYFTNNPLKSLKNIQFSQIHHWEISIDHYSQDYLDYINLYSPFPIPDDELSCLIDSVDMDEHKRNFINLEQKVRDYHYNYDQKHSKYWK